MIPKIAKILYATDLSEHSQLPLSWAMALARKHDASLVMLNVIEDFSTTSSFKIYFTDKEWQHVKQRIDHEAVDIMKKRLVDFCDTFKSGIPECTHIADEIIVRRGNPVEKIITVAEENQCDIIVMGTLGTGWISGAIMGSTARRVLRRSKLPVFVVPIGKAP